MKKMFLMVAMVALVAIILEGCAISGAPCRQVKKHKASAWSRNMF